jgi:hypothetical protein
MRHELSDCEWAEIKPMLPNKPRGVRRGSRTIRGSTSAAAVVAGLVAGAATGRIDKPIREKPWAGPSPAFAALQRGAAKAVELPELP